MPFGTFDKVPNFAGIALIRSPAAPEAEHREPVPAHDSCVQKRNVVNWR